MRFLVRQIHRKSYMESSSKDGLKARLVYLDVGQIQTLQTAGKFSKVLVRQPNKEQQKGFSRNILTVPVLSLIHI